MWVPHVLPRPFILPVHVTRLWITVCVFEMSHRTACSNFQKPNWVQSGLSSSPVTTNSTWSLSSVYVCTLSSHVSRQHFPQQQQHTHTHTHSRSQRVLESWWVKLKVWGTEERRWRKDGECKLRDRWPAHLWISNVTIATQTRSFSSQVFTCKPLPVYLNIGILREHADMSASLSVTIIRFDTSVCCVFKH